jgi:hypothetical protein
MSKKIDERLPQFIGKGRLPDYPAMKSPWERQIGYLETMHYISRYSAVISAAILQALRILVPDYEKRAEFMCKDAWERLYTNTYDGGQDWIDDKNMHPFCRGGFLGGLIGDKGDEAMLMPGRCNDFGTYRAEKELDVCDWDIVGSELCRATTASLQSNGDAIKEHFRPGYGYVEFSMVEAKGCGDRHCRVVAEDRGKFPLPERKVWQTFGPIATADQIKYTPEEDCVKEPMMFREDCNYTFTNGTNSDQDSNAVMVPFACAASVYLLPSLEYFIQKGIVDAKTAEHVLKCVCEAAGKTAFGERSAIEAQRQWLGVPREISDDDGRVMGGHIEMVLQSKMTPYKIEAFNQNEVIYVIDRGMLTVGAPRFDTAFVSYWYGMTKTLVNAQWSLWEEPGDTTPDKLRIKIAKKIDKFC